MNFTLSPCDDVRRRATELSIDRVGFARAEPVEPSAVGEYDRWLSGGNNGGMTYLERYGDLRADPRLLLPGACTVIAVAVNYHHAGRQPAGAPEIASYAHGDDYHEVVRGRLDLLAAYIREQWGGETRVCVDTAPLRERYWAVRAGVGFRGRNGAVIVPGVGSFCFLGAILTTVEFPADEVLTETCEGCGRCVRACPGRAIMSDGTVDARRCISYLTIEHRGELPSGVTTGNRLYGCDCCQQVCPHNRDIPVTGIEAFGLRPAIAALTRDSVAEMTQEQFSVIFRHSAVKRAKLVGLLRNLRHL